MEEPAENPFPLFDAYPSLAKGLPRVALAHLPTPVQPLKGLEGALDCGGRIFIKRDDLTSELYGGNKVRKLEFLLGAALRGRRRTVITFGAAGSNHALATAIYAREMGLRSISMLLPQPNAHYLRHNLLMSHRTGAELHHSRGIPSLVAQTLRQLARCAVRDRRFPEIIMPGGTSPLGIAGYVNAGFELRRQVDEGILPEPDFVYVASGTMGTAVGLLLGMRAAGLGSRIAAVRVTSPNLTGIKTARRLFRKTNVLLHGIDPHFPMFEFPEEAFWFREEFFGNEYALYTQAGMEAVSLVKEKDGIELEGTYTGKTLAALLSDASGGMLRGKTALFWNTYNSRDLSAEVAGMDFRALPKAFHDYFEQDVQPLDRKSGPLA